MRPLRRILNDPRDTQVRVCVAPEAWLNSWASDQQGSFATTAERGVHKRSKAGTGSSLHKCWGRGRCCRLRSVSQVSALDAHVHTKG